MVCEAVCHIEMCETIIKFIYINYVVFLTESAPQKCDSKPCGDAEMVKCVDVFANNEAGKSATYYCECEEPGYHYRRDHKTCEGESYFIIFHMLLFLNL